MAAENFKVKKGLEVGTAITATSSGVNVTGVVTATQFVGDGSGLTGVTGSGSGVVIKHDGSAIGTASTINFSTNLDVSAISAGIVTITASGGDVVNDTTPQLGGNLDLDGKFINGTGGASIAGVVTATTFVGNGDFVNLDVDGETDLDDLSVAGVSTFSSFVFASSNLDVDGQTDLDDVAVAGVSTFTGNIDANGNLDVDGQTDLDDVVVAGVSTFTGNIDANGNLDVDGQTDLDDVVVAGVSTFNDGITLGTNSTTFAAKFADDAIANFGGSNDLQIEHDTSQAEDMNVIKSASNQQLQIRTDKLRIIDTDATQDLIAANVDGATVLYNSGNEKFRTTGAGVSITGVCTATSFSGDGSALTGVTASGSGVIVKHDGTTVGTAGTINFSTNLDVTAISAGIVTITASSGGSNASTFTVTANNSTDETVYPIFVDGTTGSQGAESDTNLSYNPSSNILTAGTFSGNLSGTVNTAAQTSITSLGTLSALTVSGDVTANGNIVGDNSTNISGIASVTATSFHGSGIGLTSLDADNLGSGVIPNGRFPSTLPAASGANLTSLTAGNISGTIAESQIADAAVTFAKMQHVGTGVFIGRNDSGTGDIETLTAAEARTLLNVADGANVGITTSVDNVTGTWRVTASDTSHYEFTGPGQDGSEDDPDIYLVRGQRYSFINTTGNTHPFRFKLSAGGTQYTDGISGAENGTQYFNVQHDAPASLVYQCTQHPSMVGNIYIVGQHLANGANNRVLTATSAYGINAESNMTFDGDDLTISHSGLAVNIFESTDNHSRLRIRSADASLAQLEFADQNDADAGEIRYDHANEKMTFHVGSNTERVGISSSGDINVTGVGTFSGGLIHVTSATSPAIRLQDTNNANSDFKIYSPDGDNHLRIYHENTTSDLVTLTSAGKLLVGGQTSPRSTWFNQSNTFQPAIQVEGSGEPGNQYMSLTANNNASGYGARFLIGKTRGTTAGATTVVSNGDEIGGISWFGSDGSEMVEAAHILSYVDAGTGSNTVPGSLRFGTTANGAGSPTEALRIDSSGRLQLGSTTLAARNTFNGIGRLNIQNNSADGTVDFTQGIVFTDNASNEGTWTHAAIVTTGSTGYDGNLVFGTDGSDARDMSASNITEKMRLTSDGCLLVNSTAPQNSGGPDNTSSGTAAEFVFGHVNVGVEIRSTNGANNQKYLGFKYGGGPTDNGGIRRDTTSNNVEFYGGSDRRIKKNIQDMDNTLSKICQISLKKFDFKDGSGSGVGVIGQELINVFPEKVTKTDDGTGDTVPDGVEPWSVGHNYTYQILKAIQELKAENDSLKARIATLEGS